MCICVCICANNMQILGFGGVGGVRSGGGIPLGGEGGGCGGPGTGLIYTYIHMHMHMHVYHVYMYKASPLQIGTHAVIILCAWIL